MNRNVGEQIKLCRIEKKMTLKDVSEKTGLSIGYLSQLERGLTTVAYHTIVKIAKALDEELDCFISKAEKKGKCIIKSYEKKISSVDNNRYLFYMLSDMLEESEFLPRYIEILPQKENEHIEMDSHEGQEFIYVIEGVLTLNFEDCKHDLYPGDSAHFLSTKPHNWVNETMHTVKFIVINSPNMFREDSKK